MSRSSVILGIHDGHNCGACVLQEGRLVAAVQEERVVRSKNESGYPRQAIETVLEIAQCSIDDVDIVALGSRFMHSREFFQNWDWYRKGYSDQLEEMEAEPERQRYFLNERLNERKATIIQHLGIPGDRIIVVEHHAAHAAAAYYASPWATSDGKTLILTLDGSGDGICATVSIGENGDITRIAETKSKASMGKIYSRVTFLMGMKPWEHEYKVMGLAPYADENGIERSYKLIRPLVELDDESLSFQPGTDLWTNYCYPFLRSQLENHRFDWIAGAVQKRTEELVVQWVKNAVAKTGISRVCCGGGVFMNVKANMLLLGLNEIDDLSVFPSCGDESLCIGAAYKVYADCLLQRQETISLPPFESVYLGPEFDSDAIKTSLEKSHVAETYNVQFVENIGKAIAHLLSAGEIVARFDGRMEWGARALGNRSILMNSRNQQKVRELNAAIKHRDFWMPFAPTIMEEYQHEYIFNPKGIRAPYMILAFRAREKGQRDLIAASHPYDFTVRPQILSREMNPEYYGILEEFEAITGVGAVLNTSFNLHGEPIVCSPDDAISTFERSGLQILALGNYLISKKELSIENIC